MKSTTTRILLIEDDHAEIAWLRKLLANTEAPFDLFYVNSVSNALEYLQNTPCDAALLRLGLPGTHRFADLERLVAAFPSLPILVIADLDDAAVAAEFVRRGTQDYLVKDEIASPLLIRAIRNAIERKQAEDTLRREKQLSESIVNSLPAIFCLFDDRGTVHRWNRMLEQVTGYSGEEIPKMLPLDFILDSERDRVLRDIQTAFEQGAVDLKAHVLTKNGRNIPHRLIAHQMELDNRKFLLGVGIDITEMQQAEAAIQREKTFTDAIIDSLPGTFYVVDEAGKLVRGNRVMSEITGVAPDQLAGLPSLYAIHPEDQAAATAKLAEGFACGHVDAEVRMILADGTVRHFLFTGRRMILGNARFLVGTGFDITDRKRAEEELKAHQEHLEELVNIRTQEMVAAKEAAEAANRAKSDFLATISHEIRTPMTAILGYADLLMDPQLDASTRDNYATTIHRSGEYLLGLINDILDLSKIEAGKVKMLFDRCNLVAILADVAELLRPRAQMNRLQFAVEYAGPMPQTIYSDGDRLRQAIINLAGNAIKFTEKGSVRIVATFRPATPQNDATVQIDVIDTGIGISPETMTHLFRPFTQGNSFIPRKYGGTGLGLVISHHIARLLGGALTATSELGTGSTFSLTIPTGSLDGVAMLQNPTEFVIPEADRIKPWTSEVANLTGTRILLAEDGIDNRDLIETLLRHAGAEVATAENGRVAVEKTQDETFDLILMDMNMPEMDGYEATRILRDRGYRGPIVALTANAMIGDSERCLNAGCDGYLTEPIDRKRLIQLVAASIGTPIKSS